MQFLSFVPSYLFLSPKYYHSKLRTKMNLIYLVSY